MSEPLPPAIWVLVKAYLAAGKTGEIVLNVKGGKVLAYRLTECGRLDHGAVAELVGVGERAG